MTCYSKANLFAVGNQLEVQVTNWFASGTETLCTKLIQNVLNINPV